MSTPETTPTRIEEEDDGLSSFSLEQLGQKIGTFGGARLLKFNAGEYKTREGEVITPDREFMMLGLVKIVQKFVNKKLVESSVVPQRESLPDLKKMNVEAPQEEWGVDLNGKPQGPWTYTLALKLLDRGYNRYAFITNSTGGGIAVGDLTDKVKIIRRLKGRDVTAVIICEHGVRMTSKFNPNGVPRPSFRIVRYARLAGNEDVPELSPPKTPPATPAASGETRPAMTAGEQLDTFAGDSHGEKTERKYDLLYPPTPLKPSLTDEMNDTLPF